MSHQRVYKCQAEGRKLLCWWIMFPPLLSVKTINMGFSSRSVLRSFTTTWRLRRAAPSRRKTLYETKVREPPDQSHSDGVGCTGWWTADQPQQSVGFFCLFVLSSLHFVLHLTTSLFFTPSGIEALKIATRRYARKQNKWVRNRFLRREYHSPMQWVCESGVGGVLVLQTDP